MGEMAIGPATGAAAMNEYDAQVWVRLEEHWARRAKRREVPEWVATAVDRTASGARGAVQAVGAKVPDTVREAAHKAGDAVVDVAARPVIEGAGALLELVNDWAIELNDPKAVERIALKRGLEISDFAELRDHDLKTCDRLLTANTLRWRSLGAVEGGAMGALALVPVAGVPVALTADVLVIQVLSISIATRVAYAYGFDAKDPAEQEFIHRLVQRSFVQQAAKAKPLRDVAAAAEAVKGRVNWSSKLRADHKILAQVEKLAQKLGPAGARVPVQSVAKVLPFIGIVIGAGVNSAVLGQVAADAQRYCQTRVLCERYGLPMPDGLAGSEHREQDL